MSPGPFTSLFFMISIWIRLTISVSMKSREIKGRVRGHAEVATTDSRQKIWGTNKSSEGGRLCFFWREGKLIHIKYVAKAS